MAEAIEFLEKRLREQEEVLQNRKPWHDVAEISGVIDNIKSAIAELAQETVSAI